MTEMGRSAFKDFLIVLLGPHETTTRGQKRESLEAFFGGSIWQRIGAVLLKLCCIAVSRERNIDLQILLIYNLLAVCILLSRPTTLIKTLHDFNFGLVMEAAHAKHLVY